MMSACFRRNARERDWIISATLTTGVLPPRAPASWGSGALPRLSVQGPQLPGEALPLGAIDRALERAPQRRGRFTGEPELHEQLAARGVIGSVLCELPLVRERIEGQDNVDLGVMVARVSESLAELIMLAPKEQWAVLMAEAMRQLGQVVIEEIEGVESGTAH